MKKLSASSLAVLITSLPITVYAHPDSHSHYGFISFLRHFFTEPDHLFIVGLLLMVLLCSRGPVRQGLYRCLSWRRPGKK